MKSRSESCVCVPCCDCCLYSMRERIPYNGRMLNGPCVGCFKHPDTEHHNIAIEGGYCDDFCCKNTTQKVD